MSNVPTKLALIAACGLPLAAAAQDATSQTADELEEIRVVGSRTPGRSAEDSPVPVDVISAAELAQGATIGGEVGSLLQANIPSFNMPRQSNSDQGDVVRAAQLRGLSPDQVLVLINGKRRHTNAVISTESKLGKGAAPVDFNNIPTNAIERIEVLRDGAAAQYGSGAIAGVINVVLKDADAGGNVTASYGAHVTDFEPVDDNITDGETGIISYNQGFSLGDGFVNVSAEFRDRSAINRSGFDQLPTIGFAEFIVPVPPSGTPAAAPNDALAGQRNYRAGDADARDINVMFNAGFNLASDFELYSFGSYSDRKSEGYNFFRYPVSANNVFSIHPRGFLPLADAKVKDYSLAAGVRGTVATWDIDASVAHGRNKYDDNIKNSVNSSLGAASPTRFNIAEYNYSQTVLNFDASRAFETGSTTTNVAAGLEYRREQYDTKAGEEAAFAAGPNTNGRVGAQAASALQPSDVVDESRKAFSAYIDLEVDVTENLLLSAAGRFEDYDDFGDTTIGKLAARFEVVQGLALRASLSNGFRAPSLAQAFFSGGSTSFGPGGGLVRTLNLPVSSPLAQSLGAQPLRAEESVSRSAGFTWSNDVLSLTFDYYRVDIDDRIALSETIPVAGVPGVEAARFFTNVADTETKGFDVVATYASEFWEFTAAYNKSDTDVVNNPDPSIFGIEERNTYETAAPKDKLILSSLWSNGRLSVLIRATRYGETERVFSFLGDGPKQTYGAEWSLDTDIQINVNDHWSVALGANNILDNYPDESISDISYFGNLPYDTISPIGFNGRFVYFRTSYTF